jgi:hypothetical protein
MLDALEIRDGVPPGGIGILPVTTETPASLLRRAYAGAAHPGWPA